MIERSRTRDEFVLDQTALFVLAGLDLERARNETDLLARVVYNDLMDQANKD